MFDLIARVLEVEVVKEFVDFALDVLEVDFELEFTPAILCYSKGRVLEDCIPQNVRKWIGAGKAGEGEN